MNWKTALGILVAVSFVFVDQLAKEMAMQQSSVTFNSGIAFGLFSENPWIKLVIGLSVFMGLVFYLMFKRHSLALILLFFGTVSNLIDRIRFGAVVDWLAVPGLPLRNNLADWMIVVSLVWIFLAELKIKNAKKK